ncbi:MAG: lytic transglycosylase domain-containing protein [Thermoanaerobaculum sp.]
MRCLGVVLLTAWVAAPAPASFLVVLTDGGFFQAEKAALSGNDRLRVHLPEGAWVELPLSRVERVLEVAHDSSAETVEPPGVPGPVCAPGFAGQELAPSVPYAREIVAVARRHNLDPRLVAAVVEVESGFNPFAVSRVGARGLMQLMPGVWLAYGLLDPHQPAANLNAGTSHLRRLLDRFGRVDWALAAYNAGAAVVAAYGGVPPYAETQAYVARVLARWCP